MAREGIDPVLHRSHNRRREEACGWPWQGKAASLSSIDLAVGEEECAASHGKGGRYPYPPWIRQPKERRRARPTMAREGAALILHGPGS